MQNEVESSPITEGSSTATELLRVQKSTEDKITFVGSERCGSCLRFRVISGKCPYAPERTALSPVSTCPVPEARIMVVIHTDVNPTPVCDRCGGHMRLYHGRYVCPWCQSDIKPKWPARGEVR